MIQCWVQKNIYHHHALIWPVCSQLQASYTCSQKYTQGLLEQPCKEPISISNSSDKRFPTLPNLPLTQLGVKLFMKHEEFNSFEIQNQLRMKNYLYLSYISYLSSYILGMLKSLRSFLECSKKIVKNVFLKPLKHF